MLIRCGKLHWIVFLCIGLATGCAARHIKQPDSIKDAPSPLQLREIAFYHPSNLRPQDFPIVIANLEAMIPKSTDLSFQKAAHLRLVMLNLDPKNPNPSYPNALKELELYLSMDKEGGRRIENQSLLRVLRELGRVVEENKGMKAKMEQLVQENKDIRKAVEQLKSLDMTIEEKRKQVR